MGLSKAMLDVFVDIAGEVGDDGSEVESLLSLPAKQVLILLVLCHEARPQVSCRQASHES